MSKADKMFEELGYKKYESENIIQYIFDGADTIIFKKSFKDIKTYIWNDGARKLVKYINMQELQAINEKVKELRLVMKKEWKEIKGYEGKYIISNYGEIISLPRYKENKGKMQYVEPREICKYTNKKNGYVYVQLWNNAEYKNIRLHRLVAKHFIKKIEGKEQINHIDGNKQNNRADNLEWCTCSENIQHAYKIGLR